VRVAQGAAERAGFTGFVPDACLVNRYVPGAKMSLHQDRDERDYDAPIVSVSLGTAGGIPVRRHQALRPGGARAAGAR
jgi:alkylated DNA repair dioxygenase AlkB